MRTKTLALLLAGLVIVPSLWAQDCFNDLRYDNGTFENAFGTFSPTAVHFAMRFDPPPASRLERICLCWIASQGRDLVFDLLVWDDDGPDGGPGSLIGSFDGLVAENVPFQPPGAFYAFEPAEHGLDVPGSVYLGPRWRNDTHPGFFLCADYDGPSTQPGYWDDGRSAGEEPPSERLGVAAPFENYVALGLRAAFTPLGVRLSEIAEILVPGFEVDASRQDGATTFFGLRNTGTQTLGFDLEYHSAEITDTPLLVAPQTLAPGATLARNVRDDLADLDDDGLIEGLLLVRRPSAAPPLTSLPLAGDYFHLDFGNAFAGGERMVRPDDFCDVQEVRFLDFGDGTQLRILLDRPLGDAAASFTYRIYDQAGVETAQGEVFTSAHLQVVPIDAWAPAGQNFGTVVFDFTPASGGWASARYAAFAKFSVEMNAACRPE